MNAQQYKLARMAKRVAKLSGQLRWQASMLYSEAIFTEGIAQDDMFFDIVRANKETANTGHSMALSIESEVSSRFAKKVKHG